MWYSALSRSFVKVVPKVDISKGSAKTTKHGHRSEKRICVPLVSVGKIDLPCREQRLYKQLLPEPSSQWNERSDIVAGKSIIYHKKGMSSLDDVRILERNMRGIDNKRFLLVRLNFGNLGVQARQCSEAGDAPRDAR